MKEGELRRVKKPCGLPVRIQVSRFWNIRFQIKGLSVGFAEVTKLCF